jgi:hypothetical protein
MKRIESLLMLLLILTSTALTAFAQNDAGAACAAGGVILVVWLVILAAAIVIDILIIKWIKKDATAKGMPNANSIKWLGLLNWLGAVIYLLMRPKTNQ